MAARAAGLPALEGGLTFEDLARELAWRLGVPVTTQQVYYLAMRRRAVRVGQVIVKTVIEKPVLAVAPEDLDALEGAFREQYLSVDGADRSG